jgi:hypothetical protein
MKNLRIIFTWLSAICLAGFPLVGIFGGLDYIALPILLGGIFFLLMLVCKNKQLQQEERQNAQPQGDFLSPLPKAEPKPEQDELPKNSPEQLNVETVQPNSATSSDDKDE